jgi:hypothetical protein
VVEKTRLEVGWSWWWGSVLVDGVSCLMVDHVIVVIKDSRAFDVNSTMYKYYT